MAAVRLQTSTDRLTIEMSARNWTPRSVSAYQATIDSASFTSGTIGSLSPVRDPAPDAGAFIEQERSDFILFGRTGFFVVNVYDPSYYSYGGLVAFDEESAVDVGRSAYWGSVIVDVGETAVGRFEVCLDDDDAAADQSYSFLVKCVSNQVIAPTLFECLTILVPPDDCTPGADCNGNGSLDICDITFKTSEDCTRNGIPGECDLDPTDPDGDGFVSGDCHENGPPDECDIESGFSADCNGNGVPDVCRRDDCPCGGLRRRRGT